MEGDCADLHSTLHVSFYFFNTTVIYYSFQRTFELEYVKEQCRPRRAKRLFELQTKDEKGKKKGGGGHVSCSARDDIE
jgi:hypothetical protein